ncbi:MAG: 2,3,4,5-tetrahydropyridine-2,6-carboxylate N-succinyltransferase [Nautilia sp.]|nr:MAG: 2,3,4,5-tetrahydropyridine-2,6-carboxylate N-succinyltransferase [Nautilia sp.]
MIKTKEEFKELVASIEDFEGYRKPLAFGVARVDYGQVNKDKVLQAVYPLVNWNENFGSGAVIIRALIENGVSVDFNESEIVAKLNAEIVNDILDMFNPFVEEAKADKQSHKNIQVFLTLQKLFEEHDYDNYKVCILFADENPKSVESVYLKLYALSLGKVALRSINLNGAFGVLPNVAWSGNIPIELDYLRENEIELKLRDEYPEIDYVDKFPRFLQHIIPADNTRILDSAKVRFGAQLAAGTTVMPGASYINFNAGTEGAVMVEGRISSSAVVKKGADVGGGASILGVLSGTNGNPITIGENTLLGANSVTGIPLGDGCIVDAGIAVLEGTKIYISDEQKAKIKEVNPDFDTSKEVYKGLELAGLNGIHYRFDTTKGKMVAFRSVREVKLNEELH